MNPQKAHLNLYHITQLTVEMEPQILQIMIAKNVVYVLLGISYIHALPVVGALILVISYIHALSVVRALILVIIFTTAWSTVGPSWQ